jgi:hypothetical protein
MTVVTTHAEAEHFQHIRCSIVADMEMGGEQKSKDSHATTSNLDSTGDYNTGRNF